MFGSFTIPTITELEHAEDVADDACVKVLDLPDIFHPVVVVAVYTAALFDHLPSDVCWKKVYDRVDDYLERIFERATDIDRHGSVLSIDAELSLMFSTIDEMNTVITHLSDTIVDALAEYDLSSNKQWLSIVDSLQTNLNSLRYRVNYTTNNFTINLARRSLLIDM